MSMAANMVKAFLDTKEVTYREVNERTLLLTFSGFSFNSLDVGLIFEEDDRSVSLRCPRVSTFEPSKKQKLYEVCSVLNAKFKWIKFYLDEENNVIEAAIDAMIQLDSCGEECFELIGRTVSIVNEAYPEIMKAIWG